MKKGVKKGDNAFDLVFGIGFRTGFVVAIVGCFLIYMLYIQNVVNMALERLGIMDAFQELPELVKYIMAGATLAGVAICLSVFEHNLRDFIKLLFFNDKHHV
jgi:hypothetical protein